MLPKISLNQRAKSFIRSTTLLVVYKLVFDSIKVAVIADEVSKKQRECAEDLSRAEPALKAAEEALNTLNKVLLSTVTMVFLDSFTL